jgi:hypothetical protein
MRPITVPRWRNTARASPPSGRSLPTKLTSTGWLTEVAVVRVKLSIESRASARGKAVGAGLFEIEAAGGLPADAIAGEEGVDDATGSARRAGSSLMPPAFPAPQVPASRMLPRPMSMRVGSSS